MGFGTVETGVHCQPVCEQTVQAEPGIWGGQQTSAIADVRRTLKWLFQLVGKQSLLKRQPRRLRLSETLSLGEKRFVAIVEVDGSSFLVGGGSAGVSLLKQLEPAPAAFSAFQAAMQSAAQSEQA